MLRKEYNINNPQDERVVLRLLVANNNRLISGIYNSANFKNFNSKEIAYNLTKIFDAIGGVFLSKDFYASKFCVNTKNWQDYLSSEDLFKFFMFQSIIISKVANCSTRPTTNLFFKFMRDEDVLSVVPAKVTIEETKCSIPKEGAKRIFAESDENRKNVLTNMLFKLTQNTVIDKKSLEHYKEFIDRSFCFGEYSGYVSQIYFKQKTEEFEKNEEEKDVVLFGFNLSKQVGVTEDGVALYENEMGNGLELLLVEVITV